MIPSCSLLLSAVAPHGACHACHQFQLAALVVVRNAVPLYCRGKATLRTEGEAFKWHILTGFLDAAAQLAGGFEVWLFGCHEAEDNRAIFGNVPQWLKATGALVVVFE